MNLALLRPGIQIPVTDIIDFVLTCVIFLFSQDSLQDYQRSLCAAARHLDCKRDWGLVTRTEPMATSDNQWIKKW